MTKKAEITKSDNLKKSNTEKFNIALAILKNVAST